MRHCIAAQIFYTGFMNGPDGQKCHEEPPRCECRDAPMTLISRYLKSAPLREVKTYACADCGQQTTVESEV